MNRGMRCRPSPLDLVTTCSTGVRNGAHFPAAFESKLKEDFDILMPLGSGSSSSVSRAVCRADSREVALKITRSSCSDLIHCARKEYDILQMLSYPTIPRAYSFQAYTSEGRAVMSMEYFEGVELCKVSDEACGALAVEDVVLGLARQLLRTVEHLHEKGVFHRDIKPPNVLVRADFSSLFLVDFNASHCSRDGEPLTPTGTKVFAAPEILLGTAGGAAADVWGAGLCIFFALSGRLPQGRKAFGDHDSLAGRARREVSFPDRWFGRISEPCKSCLRRMLALDESGRPSATELLEADPWLSQSEVGGSR